ncbi:hypothetical protein [Streptomyces sp. t39]|uniref:hypothetical protein n=1 Tax=Streptomyces sp. t39 TaxID=1828156 RepID=UPI0011CECF05|nr:hypothetical protein [Streptomyces sp. t39]TXS55231.1 hypothetical protein EAO77_02720 [Streptomyces sp. t39]
MPTPTQHWTDSLHDSVWSLYAAAHEYQTAARAAHVALQSVEIDRRQIHEGQVDAVRLIGDRGDSQTRRREPHQQAVFALHRQYGDIARGMDRRYQDAALLYATGAVWAVNAVLDGDTPPVVEFLRDENGDLVHRAVTLPTLDRYSEATALAAAYERLATCMDAERYAEDLAGADYVTEPEAAEMFRAGAEADGMADAAFAYGLAAQKAVSFVLNGPRRERERQLALARAAAAADTTTA